MFIGLAGVQLAIVPNRSSGSFGPPEKAQSGERAKGADDDQQQQRDQILIHFDPS